jgi:acetyl esterase/lipase
MDVAYRLCPETNFIGMVGDAKRAVAWMKAHAADYGARPEQTVLMGGSAGGHIALLAAYTPDHPDLTPEDVKAADTSVLAVVSYYGVPDLRAYEKVARRFEPRGERSASAERQPPGRMAMLVDRWVFGRTLKPEQLPPTPPHRRMMRDLVGGLPDEVPERFDLASPIHHLSAVSPPTLHFHGSNDHIVPVESARTFYRALSEAGVPAVYVEFPRAPHAFDLLAPPLLSPAGQAALYDLERFLACVATQTRSARVPPRTTLPASALAASTV